MISIDPAQLRVLRRVEQPHPFGWKYRYTSLAISVICAAEKGRKTRKHVGELLPSVPAQPVPTGTIGCPKVAYITGDLADCLDDKGRMQTFARVAGPNSGIVTTSICRVAWVMIHAERWLLLIKAMGRELPLKRDQRRA